jgi:hypothetical protein
VDARQFDAGRGVLRIELECLVDRAFGADEVAARPQRKGEPRPKTCVVRTPSDQPLNRENRKWEPPPLDENRSDQALGVEVSRFALEGSTARLEGVIEASAREMPLRALEDCRNVVGRHAAERSVASAA